MTMSGSSGTVRSVLSDCPHGFTAEDAEHAERSRIPVGRRSLAGDGDGKEPENMSSPRTHRCSCFRVLPHHRPREARSDGDPSSLASVSSVPSVVNTWQQLRVSWLLSRKYPARLTAHAPAPL